MKVIPFGMKRAMASLRVEKSGVISTFLRGFTQRFPYFALADYAGREAQISAFGDLITSEKQIDISISYNYHVNPLRSITTGTSGAGTNTIDTSRLKVDVSGGVGVANIQSKRAISYVPGCDSYALFTVAFDTFKIGTTQEAGAWDDNDGYSIEMTPSGEMGIVYRKGGSIVQQRTQSEFGLDHLDGSGTSGFALNPQAMNIFRITYGYLGALPAIYEVYGGSLRGWIPFHIIDKIGEDNELIVEDPRFPVRFKATSDGSNDITMFSGSWAAGTLCSKRTHFSNDHFAFEVSKSILAGVETVLGTMRVKSTFQSKANKIPIDFTNLTAGVDGVKPHVIKVYLNTPITGASYIDPIGVNSVVEIDLTGTLTGASPSENKYTVALGRTDSLGAGKTFVPGELRLVPGDTLTFTAKSANNSDIIIAGVWDELH